MRLYGLTAFLNQSIMFRAEAIIPCKFKQKKGVKCRGRETPGRT
jgi:hypothetical protein